MLGLARVRASVSQLVKALYVSRLEDKTEQDGHLVGHTGQFIVESKGSQ